MSSNLPNKILTLLFFEDIPNYIVIVVFTLIVTLFLILVLTLIEKIKKGNIIGGLGEGAYDDALQILDRARVESMKVLSRAQSKAQHLMDDTYSLTDEARKDLTTHINSVYKKQEDYLKKSVDELISTFKSATEKGREENIRTLVETTETLKKEALSDITEFKEMLEEETIEAKQELEQKAKTEYANVQEEIDIYRQKKIKDLNNRVLDILSNVYLEVIGKELDQPKYEEMVLKLLDEEIKKSGLGGTSSHTSD